MARFRTIALAIVAVGLLSVLVLADTVKLKDGTTIEGRVIDQGDKVWVKLSDGTTRIINKSEIASIVKGDAGSVPTAGPATKPTQATAGSAARGTSFATTKSRAEKQDSPALAVSIWEKWIDANPQSPELATAKQELEKWNKLHKDEAEKINGKWVGGDEKKKLLERVGGLIREGYQGLTGSQTMQGISKLEEALKLYPQSFEANFELGYYYISKGVVGSNGQGNLAYMDKAVKSLEAAARIMPESAATWSNLAIGYNFRKKYVESVKAAYKAAKLEDSKDTVQNLVNSLAYAPRGMQQNNQEIKPIMEDAVILAQKHGVGFTGGGWRYVRPRAPGEAPAPGTAGGSGEAGEPAQGHVWSGSGFFITPDGYMITNHHVATGDAKKPVRDDISFRIRMDDGTEKNAELIAVDDDADIALLKVSFDKPLDYLQVADDNPKQASKALVLGYPDTGPGTKPALQVSEGTVKSINPGSDCEVWFDLNTTHGNSGGPIVDKSCRVISILTGGRQSHNMMIVLGVGPLQIKRFLDKLGDKAPTLHYTAASPGEFDGEKLTDQARKATTLVMAIKGPKGSGGLGTATTQPSTQPSQPDQPQPQQPPADGNNPGQGQADKDAESAP